MFVSCINQNVKNLQTELNLQGQGGLKQRRNRLFVIQRPNFVRINEFISSRVDKKMKSYKVTEIRGFKIWKSVATLKFTERYFC